METFLLTRQTIVHLQDKHPHLKKQPIINWIFRALSEECEGGGTLGKNILYIT